MANKPLLSFKDEVLEARDVRNSLADGQPAEDLLAPSIEAAKILHDHDLDGRSIEGTALKTSRMWISGLVGIFLMILAAPITIPSTGVQAFFAWYMGDRTDEGIDARTTYHFLAGMFSPILFWIPIAIASSTILITPSMASFPINLGLVAIIVLSLIHI